MQQQNVDGDDGEEDGGIDEDNTPETQKAKLKILQQEFAAEMKKKTEKIKPRLIGCIWLNGDEDDEGATLSPKKYHCSDVIWKILKVSFCGKIFQNNLMKKFYFEFFRHVKFCVIKKEFHLKKKIE